MIKKVPSKEGQKTKKINRSPIMLYIFLLSTILLTFVLTYFFIYDIKLLSNREVTIAETFNHQPNYSNNLTVILKEINPNTGIAAINIQFKSYDEEILMLSKLEILIQDGRVEYFG